MAFLSRTFLSISLCVLLFHITAAFSKYSVEANKPKYEDPLQFPTSLRELDKPFRMAKLNVLWVKAKNVRINILQRYISNICKNVYIYIYICKDILLIYVKIYTCRLIFFVAFDRYKTAVNIQ